jgi:uncharacterized membrane protein YfcA
VTVITDPLFYVLAVPAVVALGLSKGGFSGVGQMATPMLALVMPPLEAAAIMLPIMLVQDAFALWVYRKEWNGRILAVLIPGAIVGIGLAWWLAAYISDAAVRVFIGVTTIGYVLHTWIGPARVARKAGNANAGAGVFLGRSLRLHVNALPGGRTALPDVRAVAEPVEDDFRRHQRDFLRHHELVQVAPYFALGQFSTKGFATSLVLLPLAIVTNQIGFWVVRVTPAAVFFRVTMIILFLISLELTRSGMTDILGG